MNTKTELTVNEFKENYCSTLQIEPNGESFVKIPVNDYTDLSLMSYYLINAIDLIGQAHNYNNQDDELSYTIQHLTHILKAISMHGESEGLNRLLKL